MTVKIKQTVYELLPVGEYIAKIIGIEEDEGMYGPQVRFEFEIQGGDYAGQTLLAWATATFSSKSKLYAWSRAALNANISPDYDFNSDDLLGRLVRVTFVVRSSEDGTEYNRVETVRPYGHNRNDGSKPPSSSTSDDIPF